MIGAIRRGLGYAIGAIGIAFGLVAVGLILLANKVAGWNADGRGGGFEL